MSGLCPRIFGILFLDILNKKHFVAFLKDNEITYEDIDYKHEKGNLYEYIQNEI
jgi:hypothetical protein